MDALRCANCHKYIPSKEMPTTEEYSPAIGESFNYYCKDCLKKLQEQGIIQTKQRRDNMADITKPQNLEDMYLEPFILKQFNKLFATHIIRKRPKALTRAARK